MVSVSKRSIFSQNGMNLVLNGIMEFLFKKNCIKRYGTVEYAEIWKIISESVKLHFLSLRSIFWHFNFKVFDSLFLSFVLILIKVLWELLSSIDEDIFTISGNGFVAKLCHLFTSTEMATKLLASGWQLNQIK